MGIGDCSGGIAKSKIGARITLFPASFVTTKALLSGFHILWKSNTSVFFERVIKFRVTNNLKAITFVEVKGNLLFPTIPVSFRDHCTDFCIISDSDDPLVDFGYRSLTERLLCKSQERLQKLNISYVTPLNRISICGKSCKQDSFLEAKRTFPVECRLIGC